MNQILPLKNEGKAKETEMALHQAFAIFKREGVGVLSEKELAEELQMSPERFRELFSNPENLLLESIRYDLVEDKNEKALMLAKAANPAEELMMLVANGIRKAGQTNPAFFQQLQEHHPAAWMLYQKYFQEESYYLVYDILNRGVLQGVFRKDINLALVTHIIFEQLNMLLNPTAFPPERYALDEVFRSVFLYYVRGLCTEQGMRLGESFFAKSVR